MPSPASAAAAHAAAAPATAASAPHLSSLRGPYPRRPLTRSPDPVRQSEERERLYAHKAKGHAELAHLAPSERMSALARRVVASKNQSGKCDKCWLVPRLCLCPIPPLSCNYRFGVYMHFKGAPQICRPPACTQAAPDLTDTTCPS